jgi:adenylate kinase
MSKSVIIFFGPPGSGKGTQADLLARRTGWKKISTGDLLRAEVAAGTKLGKLASKYQARGKLVPDKLLVGLVGNGLKIKSRGFIFDGYPRNLKQLKDLLAMFKKRISQSDSVYALEVAVSDREVKQRLGLRRICDCGAVYHLKYNPPINDEICDVCGQKIFVRNDDQPKVIARRLKIYHQSSRALLDYWQKRGKLIKINGEQPIKKIHEEIMERLEEFKLA